MNSDRKALLFFLALIIVITQNIKTRASGIVEACVGIAMILLWITNKKEERKDKLPSKKLTKKDRSI